MNVLVTGGAGFIGSHLVERLLNRGDKVTVVDNFDPFYSRVLKEANIDSFRSNSDFELIEMDITSDGLYEQLSGRCFDSIVHLAAKAGVRPSITDPEGYYHVNVIGTQKLLEYSRSNGRPRFVFASSSSVYGISPEIPWSEDLSVLKPISPYAGTKVSGELLGHVYAHLYGISFISLRFFTVYGPRQRPDLAIRKFAEAIAGGRSIPVFGDGTTSRDYTHVFDVVDGILGSLSIDGIKYDVFNLGNDYGITLARMIECIERAVGREAKIQRLPEQLGDVSITRASISKAKKFLGYAPRISFDEGITDFIEQLSGS
ncbi:MAG: GDP-mannose 4,6-dehydratase [Verrucomicrobiae bacterium]|nr:GDP-mannose 4,6-dehydratase [Verrucomicrobiae bacterium]